MSRIEGYPRLRARAPGGRAIDLLLAQGTRARMVGLLGSGGLPPGTGLLIPTCDSVHTAGMGFPIDVAFARWPAVEGRIEVLGVRPELGAWRFARVSRRGTGLRRREVAALELPAGDASELGLQEGSSLEVEE